MDNTEQEREVQAIPQMDVAFNHILLWKPSQITNFLKEAHNTIKAKQRKPERKTGKSKNPSRTAPGKKVNVVNADDDNLNGAKTEPSAGDNPQHDLNAEENQMSSEREIQMIKLNLEADKHQFLPKHGDWKKVLDSAEEDLGNPEPKHFGILTSRSKASLSSTSVADLLGVMRNKSEHYHEFTESERQELGWSADVKAEEPDHALYVQFWSDRFPKLLAYLWLKFYKFQDKSTMKPFYKVALNSESLYGPIGLVGNIYDTLLHQVEKGELEARYSSTSDSQPKLTLEFRSIPVGLQHAILTGSNSWKMEIPASHDKVLLKWADGRGNDVDVCYGVTPKNEDELNIWAEHVTLIVTNDSAADADGPFAHRHGERQRIIYFTNKPKAEIDLLATNISRVCNIAIQSDPISWSDLTEVLHKAVENEGEISLQGKMMKFKCLLPDDEKGRATVLSNLKGDILNNILKGRKPELVQHNPPIVTDPYIVRNIYSREELSPSVFRYCSHNETFFVFDITIDKLCDMLLKNGIDDSLVKNITELDSLQEFSHLKAVNHRTQIFVTTKRAADIKEEFENMVGKIEGRMHLLRCINGSTFQWISTHGNFAGVREAFAMASRDVRNFQPEKKFLDQRERSKTNERMIVIADVAAMGKSHILKSLAYQLHKWEDINRQLTEGIYSTSVSERMKKCDDRIVLSFTMTNFVHHLNETMETSTAINVEHVVSTIKKLSCSGAFEELVAETLLKRDNDEGGIMFEILLDGLDEVANEGMELALTTLDIILRDLKSMRIWVAVREHMLDDVQKRYGCLGYKMEPFWKHEAMTFLTKYWNMHWQKHNPDESILTKNPIPIFARRCIELPITKAVRGDAAVTGSPLICQMIAEIHEDKMTDVTGLLSQNSTLSLIEIYEQMIERKLEVYIKGKNGLPEIKMDSPLVRTFRENMEQAHIYFALKLIFSEDDANEIFRQLVVTADGIEQFHVDILEQGLIDHLEPLAFIHRTFAEYFVALFFYNIFIGKYMRINQCDPVFNKFIWSEIFAFKLTKDSAGSILCKFKHPIIYQFFDAMCERNLPRKYVAPIHKHFIVSTLWHCREQRIHLDTVPEMVSVLRRFTEKDGYNDMSYEARKEDMIALFIVVIKCEMFDLAKYMINCQNDFRLSYLSDLQKDHKIGLLHFLVERLLLLEKEASPKACKRRVCEVQRFIDFVLGEDQCYLEQRDSEGRTPLLALAQVDFTGYRLSKHMKILEYVVTHLRPCVNATDNNGNTVMHIPDDSYSHTYVPFDVETWWGHHTKVMQFFMQNGFNGINSPNICGDSPLHTFSSSFVTTANSWKALEAFKKHGAELSAKNNNGHTVLHVATTSGVPSRFLPDNPEQNRYNFIQTLIEQGVDISVEDGNGHCALHLAMTNCRVDIATLLIDRFPDCLHAVSFSKNENHFADFKLQHPMVYKFFNALRQKGENKPLVSAQYIHYILTTIAHCVLNKISIDNVIEVSSILVNFQLNPSSESAQTDIFKLLIAALKCKFFDLGRELIENEETCHHSNWSRFQEFEGKGLGILHLLLNGAYECRNSWPPVREFIDFIQYVYKLDATILEQTDPNGRTPLFSLLQLAVFCGSCPTYNEYIQLYEKFVEILKPNLNAVDNEGNTLLHASVLSEFQDKLSHDNMQRLLTRYAAWIPFAIKMGFNGINHKNKEGATPLLTCLTQFVSGSGSVEVIEKFICTNETDFALCDKYGNSALQLTASAFNDMRRCALLWAAQWGNIKVVKELIKHYSWGCLSQVDRGKLEQLLNSGSTRDILGLQLKSMAHSDTQCLKSPEYLTSTQYCEANHFDEIGG